MFKNNLYGSVALVTGVNSYIGAQITRDLLKHGAGVVGTYLPEHEHTGVTVDALRNEYNGNRCLVLHSFDQTIDNDIATLMRTIRENFTGLHLLVTVASCQYPERFLDQSFEQIDRQVTVNLTSTVKLVQAAAKLMIETNVESSRHLAMGIMGSVRGSIPVKPDAYEFAKAGLHHMVRGLATELGEHGISINAIAPGTVDCPLEHERYGSESAYRPAWESVTPLNRLYRTSSLVTPSDVSDAMLFALNHPSITGNVFDVSGGYKYMPLLPMNPEA